jgi:hypothetical protein
MKTIKKFDVIHYDYASFLSDVSDTTVYKGLIPLTPNIYLYKGDDKREVYGAVTILFNLRDRVISEQEQFIKANGEDYGLPYFGELKKEK